MSMKPENTENIPVGKWRRKDKMSSSQNPILQDLSKAVVALDLEAVKESTMKALDEQIAPQLIIKDGLNPGLVDVGTKFASGEYFLSQLIWAGQIMNEAMNILKPHLSNGETGSSGKIVIATVEGDLHDIGKNIAITMLKSAGCAYVIIGHSERRSYFGETDGMVNKRIFAALEEGLKPIVCVGETLQEREAGTTFDVVKRQVTEGLANLSTEQMKNIVVAYEPVWAIGTGVTATPEQAQELYDSVKSGKE